MRSVTSILLFLLLFQPISFITIFKIEQYEIRNEIKQRIMAGVNKDNLLRIKLPRNSEKVTGYLSWLISERELRLQGKMYDIVREENRGDTTWYYCILDEQETELFANLDLEIDWEMNNSPQREQRRKALERIFTLLLFQPQNFPDIIHFPEEPELSDYYFSSITWKTSPSTPPPQV